MLFESNRCYIRHFIEDDLDSFMEYRNNLDWMKFQGFKGLSKDEYKCSLFNKSITNGIQLAIISKQSNKLLGDIYLQQDNDACYIGYTINPKFAKNGIITEVLYSCIHYLKTKNFNQIKAGVDPLNTSSINLLKKLNFTFSHIDEEHIYLLDI